MQRHKTEGPKQKNQDEGFELKGWNYDIDELASSKNLLRILEKKITFPALQNIKNNKPHISKKLQTLPAIMEAVSSELPTHEKVSKIESAKISQIIKQAKEKKVNSPGEQNKISIDARNFNFDKPKPLSIECRKHFTQQAQKCDTNKKNNGKLNVLIHKSHTTLFKWTQGNQQSVSKPRTIQQIMKSKHQKISSVVNLPAKTKLRIFNEFDSQQKLQQQLRNRQKNIKWDRFSKSQQKTVKTNKVQKQQRQRIAKIHKLIEESNTKVNWFQKLFQVKNKAQTRLKNRSPKANENDFIDDHLQSTQF